ncbi:YcaO-like family protein [Dongia sp.]|uniref:YcaO-like family protein n=1 Tax=Dongia sp. TaxID=1977262 RepID=UPI003750BB5A
MDFVNFAISGCPAVFIVAMQRAPDGKPEMAGAGRGLTKEAAIAGCVAETVERAAAARRDGLNVIEAAAAALPLPPFCLPNDIWCLSERQLVHGPHPAEDVAPEAWRASLDLHAACRSWCEGRTAVSAAAAFVPLANVLIGGTLTDSNGVAAGRSLQAAETSAVLELVERDAVAVWWYGRVQRPAVALELLDDSGGSLLREWLQSRDRRTWLLDLTHDLHTPVAAAVSCGPDGHDIAYGFAARLTLAEAALSASLEMLQTELSLKLARSAASQGALDGHGARLLGWSQRSSVARLPFLAPHEDAVAVEPVSGDPVAAITRLIGREPVFIDLQRSDAGLAVVRAVAPGLRPWWPRFAPGRLATVPGRLGWVAQSIDEEVVGDDVILI